MSRLRKITGYIVIAIVAAGSAGVVLSGFDCTASAQRGPHHEEYRDFRYHHDRYYPAPGRYVVALPPGHRMIVHGGAHFYFHEGIWYRPEGARFVIVAPPIGIVVPFLPPFYTTIRIGGMPYYYANEVYYVQTPGGYMVTEQPGNEVPPTVAAEPSGANRIFIYPRQGQSQQQQAKDEYECHRWAAGQTGFDPTQPLSTEAGSQKRSDYQRAMGACLDARGYTTK